MTSILLKYEEKDKEIKELFSYMLQQKRAATTPYLDEVSPYCRRS